MATLSTKGLHLAYESVSVLQNIDLVIPEGKITVLIGANGCGKSTILRSLARLLKPTKGVVYLDGKEIHKQPGKQIAKKLAILPQGPEAPEGLTVKELCYYGRHPHKGIFSKNTAKDHEMVQWALKSMMMEEFTDRPVESLSGGQRQRAWIAMALAQGTDLLLLDEPTTYLDLAHQIEVLELLSELNLKYGRTIVMVLHELNQAARYADYLISISQGSIYKEGSVEEVFTKEMLQNVFGLEAYVMKDPVTGTPMCVPIGLKTRQKKKTYSVS